MRGQAATRCVLTTLVASILAGCGGGLDGDTKEEARRSAAAWAGFRGDVDDLGGRLATQRGPEAKQELVAKCRAQRARLRSTESRFAPVVKDLCDDIEAEPAGSG